MRAFVRACAICTQTMEYIHKNHAQSLAPLPMDESGVIVYTKTCLEKCVKMHAKMNTITNIKHAAYSNEKEDVYENRF